MLYSALFLICGAVLLAITYSLFANFEHADRLLVPRRSGRNLIQRPARRRQELLECLAVQQMAAAERLAS